jgi:dienelactone hydrolase
VATGGASDGRGGRGAGGLGRAWSRAAPSAQAWRGATAGVVVVTVGLWAWFVANLITPASVLAPLLVGVALLVAAAAVGALAALVVRLVRVRVVPGHVIWAVVAALPLLHLMTRVGLSSRAQLLLVGLVLAAAALAGGAVAALASRGLGPRSPLGRVALVLSLAAGVGMLLGGAALLAWDGPGAGRAPALSASLARAHALSLPDPSAPGAFPVRRLTYGAGTDRHRREFAAGATLRARPVDGTRLLPGWSGVTGRAREAFWGFGPEALPLNARVWYPDAAGRFPLVLILHGDHLASDFSDEGYAYLGERLASRGYVVASIDENFLNTSVGDLSALGVSRFALQDDMPARAWLLLEHLRLWRGWSEQPGHRFFRRVDLDDVGLVGHSRGGEAVALANVFNGMDAFPEDRAQRFDYGFGIRAVAALAPTDDTYRPGGRAVRLRGVDLLVMGGSHDADVLSFEGTNQVRRARLGPDRFAAAVYVHRANHGHFNSTWGRYDKGSGAARRLLATSALLPAAQQRRVARVFVSGFLDAALKGRRGYLSLFRDPGAGVRWLPRTAYVAQLAGAGARSLMNADEDRDPRTTSVAGGVADGTGLAEWREERIALRAGPSPSRAVMLGWAARARARPAAYSVAFGSRGVAVGDRGEVVFSLADVEPAARPIDLTLEVTDGDGTVVRRPLSADAPLEPRFTSRRLKIAAAQAGPAGEPVFQTFAVAMEDLATADRAFDPSRVREMRLVFDRTRSGRVLLDDVGVRATGLSSRR